MASKLPWSIATIQGPQFLANGTGTIYRMALQLSPTAAFQPALHARLGELVHKPLAAAADQALRRAPETAAYKAALARLTQTRHDRDAEGRRRTRLEVDRREALANLAGAAVAERVAAIDRNLADSRAKLQAFEEALRGQEAEADRKRAEAEETVARAHREADLKATQAAEQARAALLQSIERDLADRLTELAALDQALTQMRGGGHGPSGASEAVARAALEAIANQA